MTKFLTINEAADLSGKAEITIRRLIRTIVKDDKSDQRCMVQPDVKEVAKLKKSKKPFAWKIAEELVKEKYMSDGTKKTNAADAAIIETLRNQLKVKDKQIDSLTDIVQELNERVREGNILMGSLQQHLALPEPEKGKTVQACAEQSRSAEAVKKKAAQKKMTPKPAQKKGFFAKMFG